MHPRNFSPHHPVTTFKIGEWHYNRVRKGNLDDGLADPSRGGVDAQGIVDGLLRRFGAGGLAHMHGRPIGASEGGSDALLTFEDSTKRRPTGAVTGWTQAGPDHLGEIVVADTAGAGATDEHADTIAGAGFGRDASHYVYGTTSASLTTHQWVI